MLNRLFVLCALCVFLQCLRTSYSSPVKSSDFAESAAVKRTGHIGKCPAFPPPRECPAGEADDVCKSDEDCSLTKKCCSDGCGRLCIEPIGDESECKDLREDCKDIPVKGKKLAEYCKLWKKFPAVKACRKTCGWCKAPAPTVCKDSRDDCKWILRNAGHYLADYCHNNRDDPAVMECQETCGLCKAPAPTVCKDSRDDCKWILRNAGHYLADYCHNNRDDPAVMECQETCGLCDKLPRELEPIISKRSAREVNDESECKDLLDECKDIPQTGAQLTAYCEHWKDHPAVSKCKKTCGWCKPPSPTKCADKRADCHWIATFAGHYLAEYCQQHQDDPAVQDCQKTCGFCNKLPSPTEAPPPPPKPQTQPQVTERPVTEPNPTQKPSVLPESGGITGFQKECLDAHNKYRASHGAPPLQWSAELTNNAQAYANHLAREKKFEHDKPELERLGEGENLAWFSPPNRKCNGPSDVHCVHCGEVVQDWYNEIDDYDFSRGKGKPFTVVLHFTQVVWKGTTHVGMATAVGHDRFVSVARYKKPGNLGSTEDFKKNVLKS